MTTDVKIPQGEHFSEADFVEYVCQEVRRSRKKHPKAMQSWHQAYGIILEEVDEFWDEVKKQTYGRHRDAMLVELVQIAAMAVRAAVDMDVDGRPYREGIEKKAMDTLIGVAGKVEAKIGGESK